MVDCADVTECLGTSFVRRFIQVGILSSAPYCSTTNDTRRPVARKYLEETIGHKCAICGVTMWNGQPIPLVVDHIDGDSTNHAISNIRLICYNCDAQTLSFKRRGNHTSTRIWRSKYTKKNQSIV